MRDLDKEINGHNLFQYLSELVWWRHPYMCTDDRSTSTTLSSVVYFLVPVRNGSLPIRAIFFMAKSKNSKRCKARLNKYSRAKRGNVCTCGPNFITSEARIRLIKNTNMYVRINFCTSEARQRMIKQIRFWNKYIPANWCNVCTYDPNFHMSKTKQRMKEENK